MLSCEKRKKTYYTTAVIVLRQYYEGWDEQCRSHRSISIELVTYLLPTRKPVFNPDRAIFKPREREQSSGLRQCSALRSERKHRFLRRPCFDLKEVSVIHVLSGLPPPLQLTYTLHHHTAPAYQWHRTPAGLLHILSPTGFRFWTKYSPLFCIHSFWFFY